MGGYPDAFDYPEGGEEARKVWNDAQVVLDELEQNHKLNPSGILGIFPAERVGDDVVLFADEERTHQSAQPMAYVNKPNVAKIVKVRLTLP